MMSMAVVACGGSDAELQSEVASLRGDLTSLREQVRASETPLATSTTANALLTTTTAVVPTTTLPVDDPVPVFPAEFQDFTHGGDAWVVILAASEGYADPGLKTATIAATAAGYSAYPTNCDLGATEALGLPPDRSYYTVSVYLASEADANTALESFEKLGVGGVVAVVQTLCLD